MAKLSLAVGSAWLNLILLLVLGLLILDAIINPLGLRDLAILRHDRIGLEAARDRLSSENAQRKDVIARLRGDDAYLERLIHQELGYVRPDELIYHFPGRSDDAGDEDDTAGAPAK